MQKFLSLELVPSGDRMKTDPCSTFSSITIFVRQYIISTAIISDIWRRQI